MASDAERAIDVYLHAHGSPLLRMQATLDHFGLTLPPEPSPAEMLADRLREGFLDAWGGCNGAALGTMREVIASALANGTLKAAVDAHDAMGGE